MKTFEKLVGGAHARFAVLALPFALCAPLVTNSAEVVSPCEQSAGEIYKSCRYDALSQYWLQRAQCTNLATPAESAACRQVALTDLNDALALCADQRESREDACDRLGGGIYNPVINPNQYVGVVDNPYFPLVPGTTRVYEGLTPRGMEHSEFHITHNTRVILGVTCTEVEDTVKLAGVIIEQTLDWFAQDTAGNVWYFGELSFSFQDGLIADLHGTWRSGQDGAKPGIVMKAHPHVGDFYRQEFLPQTAEDLAGVLSVSASVVVPFGSFSGCVQTEDFTPIAPDHIEQKFYAAGIGTVLEVNPATGARTELIAILTH